MQSGVSMRCLETKLKQLTDHHRSFNIKVC